MPKNSSQRRPKKGMTFTNGLQMAFIYFHLLIDFIIYFI